MTTSLFAKLRRSPWAAAVLVAALQTAVLAWIVWNRVDLLRNGREIVVDVVPVDPRDLFRGDYVILGYDFTTSGNITLPPGARKGDRAYASIAKNADRKWTVRAISSSYPTGSAPDEVVLKGIVDYVTPIDAEGRQTVGNLRYGIESYFVPEGTGKPLEDQVRERRIEAVLAVGRGGEVAIKALKIDGTLLAQEPVL